MAIKLSYKGFSLIETLIIVVIISLLAAIAIPAFIGYKADTEKRQLLSKVNSFYAAVSVCLMDDDIANCSTKKKLGFYCPVGCSDVEAGPIQQGQNNRPIKCFDHYKRFKSLCKLHRPSG